MGHRCNVRPGLLSSRYFRIEELKEDKMQAVKEKLSDMSSMRKAKADAKAEEKAEKEYAKTRVEVAKEIRKAKEAEAAMDLHVSKAEKKVDAEIAKHSPQLTHDPVGGTTDHHGHFSDNMACPTGMGSTDPNIPPHVGPTNNKFL